MPATNVLHRVLEPILQSRPPEAVCLIGRAQADEQLQQRVEAIEDIAEHGISQHD